MRANQSGYLKATRNNSYRIAVSLGKTEGKYRYHFETVKGSRKAAEKRLAELQSELARGVFVKPSKLKVADYLTAWLSDCCTNLAPKTIELYNYIIRVHITPAIGMIPLTDLRPQHLQHLYSQKLSSGLSPRTVQICHVCIHKALKNAVKTNLLHRNVADSVDKPKGERPEIHPMSENDIDIFLEAAKDGQYYALFFFYIFTGMRRCELLAVRWSDVDLLGMTISVNRSMQALNKTKIRITFKEPKSKRSRRLIALSPLSCEVLRQHKTKQNELRRELSLPVLTDADLVFAHYDGSPQPPDTITHAWAKLIKRCGLKGVRLHDARHSMATLLLKQGVHPKIVQERLGHATISTTLDIYSHVAPGMQQAAAAGLDAMLSKKITKIDRELDQILK